MTTLPSRTLILIKPDAVRRSLTGEVLRRFEAKGYKLVALRLVQASKEMLAEHYAEHVSKPFYPGVEQYMSSGPLVALVLEGLRVVEGSRSLMGTTDPTTAAPGTIRGDLGRDWDGETMENLVHGSDCEESAAREIAIWFPELAG
ncbi:Nucleoside diphosphate kinase [Actinomyces bovis]|uniref:Nucleoside diphosphate kinase n=1 Tax=Actinomyces bovis TaxID=1658 RepID=A0ABY1VKQ6_9ACTO|nr:nucleoside-diphosphate kinase [Actinomyces bovis]SPT52676.1 Nucleoside diphosphate kinase [Actinomyces bovis]VEG54597.1 Nucleoside diphosphate kinase [Actinomyces israelii]